MQKSRSSGSGSFLSPTASQPSCPILRSGSGRAGSFPGGAQSFVSSSPAADSLQWNLDRCFWRLRFCAAGIGRLLGHDRRPCLHEFQDGAALVRDSPASAQPLDQLLGEDIQIRYARAQTLGPLGPVPAAGRKDCHVAFEVRHDGKPVRIAHQDLQDSDLKIHATLAT
nr:hypothetical protein BDOA9_0201040 [Bradyrhizobium sp. DOA9]